MEDDKGILYKGEIIMNKFIIVLGVLFVSACCMGKKECPPVQECSCNDKLVDPCETGPSGMMCALCKSTCGEDKDCRAKCNRDQNPYK